MDLTKANIHPIVTTVHEHDKNGKILTRDEFHKEHYEYALHRYYADGGNAVYTCEYENCSRQNRGTGYCYLHCSCTICAKEKTVYEQYCSKIKK